VTEATNSLPARRGRRRIRHFRVGALIVILVAAGIVGWLVLRDNGGSSSSSNATAVSVSQIQDLATSVGHPIFWVGPKAGSTYELTRNSNGSILIRYLSAGVKIGAKTPSLTVATYPFPGAFAAIQAVAKESGSTRIPLAGKGLAEVSTRDPKRVHAAYPGVDYQVEVFDPTPGAARALVAAGRLNVFGSLKGGSTSAAQPKAVSPAGLRSLAKSLGHSVYWVGPKKGDTYELTKVAGGQVYIRYLPAGTNVGSSAPYLTVATYPFPKAFEAIQALAQQTNAVAINLAGGGLAVVDTRAPTSIHLAYPGSDYQVEVFDPSPARARQVVSSNQVKSIG
jgi:hypothetical protein